MKPMPVFDPQTFLAKAAEGQTITRYQAGQVVFAQGDPADAVFYLQSGKIKVTVLSQQGKEAVLALLGAGDFFGEGCMTGQPSRMTSAVAMEECMMARLEKAVVLRTLHDESAFAELFISYLLQRNLRMESDLVDQLFNSSEKRLARLLLILANFGSRRHQVRGHLEPRRQSRGFHLRRRHARHRSQNERPGAGLASAHSTGLPQSEIDR